MKKLRVGLVGMAQGYYATLYSRACAQRKDVDFIGVCDLGMPVEDVRACAEITAEELARELDVPLFHGFEDLMEQAPTALIVTNETANHHVYAVQAIDAGVHVFIGKPMTVTLSAAREIEVAASRNPSVVVQPGQPARYEEGIIQARQRLQAGDIGPPLMVHVFVNHLAMTNHAWEMDVRLSGGPLIEFGSYAVDLAEWVVGSPITSVYAHAANFMHPQIAGPDNVKALVEHASGTLSSLDVCSSISWNYPFLGLEIVGESGCIRADYHNYPLYVQRADRCQLSAPRYSLMNQREIEHFLECVQRGARPAITPHDYVSTVEVLEAIRQALAQRTGIDLDRREG